MGKQLRYILLSFTVVLAIFLFALLWQVRPGHDSSILNEARARQQKTLLEVQKPLVTDVVELSEEEKMSEKVSDILLTDEAFASAVAEKLEEMIPPYVEKYTAEYISTLKADIIAEVSSQVLNDKSTLFTEIEQSILSLLDQKIATSEDALYSYIDTKENDMYFYIDLKESELIELVTTEVYKAYEEKRGEIEESLMKEISDYVVANEESIVNAVGKAYAEKLLAATEGSVEDPVFNEIVYNTSSDIMASIAGDEAVSVEGRTDLEENADRAIENIVLQVLDRIDLALLNQSQVAPTSLEPIEEVPAAPSVVAVNPVETVVPEDYDYVTERNNKRKAEIERVLSSLRAE